MATGGPSSLAFDVQWDGVNWTSEAAALKGSEAFAVRVTRGRATEADDLQTTVMSGVWDNVTGRYTADSPLSPLYPLNVDGKLTRFGVVKGAASWWRHRGRLVTGEPQLADAERQGERSAIVPFESVGLLGPLAGRRLRCDFVERWLNRAETQKVDLFPLEGTQPSNLSNGGGTARIVPAKTGAGTFDVGIPDGVMLDSQLTLTSTGGVGPTLVCRVGSAVTAANMIVVTFRSAGRTPTAPAGVRRRIVVGYDVNGDQAWALRFTDNAGQCDINLYDASDTFFATVYSAFSAVGSDTGDDQWYALSLEGTSWFFRRVADNVIVSSGSAVGLTPTLTRSLLFGGGLSVTYGTVVVSDAASISYTDYLSPNAATTAQARFLDMNLYADFASAQNGARNRSVARKSISGRSAFDVIAEVTRTVGATVTENRSGLFLDFWDADTLRRPTVKFTVDVDADLGADFPWRKSAAPSSVTATWPGGQVTFTDPTRPQVDEQVETCADTEQHARDVAAARVNASRRLRLTRLVLDLADAANDLWASVMTMEVGDRIRVNLGSASSLLVQQFGYTYVDVYVAGWTETYANGTALFEIDTDPADDPAGGQFGTGLRSKFSAGGTMTVTGGTCVGSTSTGTLVVTTTAGSATVTQNAAAYPITFDWNGEWVTVASPPASATSPQTLTVTARGVAPTVTRSHGTGEPFDVALAPSFVF